MTNDKHDNRDRSPFDGGAGLRPASHKGSGGNGSETQNAIIEELQRVNEELRQARRAALNLMEDAILSKEALRESEEKYRTRLEQDVHDRTAELKANKDLLQATMNASMDMIQVFEAVRNEQGQIVDFRYVLLNHEAERWMPEHTIGNSLLQLQPGVVIEGIFDIFKKVVETGVPEQSEHHYVHEQFNGWFYQSVVKLGDGVATTTSNITQRKKAEQDLQQSKTLLQDVIDAPRIGMAVYKAIRNEKGEITDFVHEYINRASINMFGGEDFTGKLFTDHGENAILQMPQFIQVIQTGKGNDYIREADFRGRKVWFAITNTPLDGDRLVHTWEDVTERKKSEAEILGLKDEIAQKATDKYLTLFNAIDEAFCIIEPVLDEQGNIVDFIHLEANAAYYVHTGFENIIGKTILEAMPGEGQELIEYYGHVALTGEPVRKEYYVETMDRWYTAFHTRVENTMQVAIIFNNITERKNAEREQAFLLKLSDLLRPLKDPAEIQQAAIWLIGEHLGAHRAFYSQMLDDEDTMLVGPCYADTVSPISGPMKLSDFESGLLDNYRQGETVVINNVYTDYNNSVRNIAAVKSIQVMAAVGVPLLKAGKVRGILSIHQSHPRKWTVAEIILIEETAERIWAAVERARAEEALRKSEEEFRAVFETIDEGFALMELVRNNKGKVTDLIYRQVNESFKQFTGLQDALNRKGSELMPNLEQSLLDVMQSVADAGETYRSEDYVSDLERWYDVHYTCIGEPGSNFIVAVFKDTTERKRREEHLAFLADIAEDFSYPWSAEKIMQTVGKKTGAYLNITNCNFTDVQQADDQVTVSYGWSHPAVPRTVGTFRLSQYLDKEFERASRAGETVVVCNTQADARTDAAGFAALEIYSFVTVPFHSRGKWTHYIAIGHSKTRNWRGDEIKLIEEIANRLFHRLERAKAEDALRQSEERKEFILKLNDTLRALNDPVEIEYEAARLVAEKLEADRVHFAELSEDEKLVIRKDYVRANAPSLAGVANAKVIATALKLEREEPVVIRDVQAFPHLTEEEKATLAAAKIRSQLSVALSIKGKKVASFSVDHTAPREWKPLEISILQEAAERTLAAVEKAKAEEALKQSEDRFRTLSDAVPQVIWTNDAAGNANYFNQRWYQYSGLPFEQSEGLGWQAIVHPLDAPESIAKWKNALAKGEVFDTEYRLRRHDGSYCWHIGRNVPMKDDSGKVTGWFGSATDIENLKKTEEALSQSEARLRITMESATDYAIITMDRERRVEKWSSGAVQLFDYSESEMIGQSADIIFTEEDLKAGAPQQEMESARDTGRAADERWHRHKDGSRFYASGVLRPIQNDELTGYVKVMRDMTEQQLFTEELHRLVAERTVELQRSNEDLRQFAHVASHDLKEPVRKIQTFNNRILDEFAEELPSKVKTYSEKIGTAAGRMIEMIEGVLRYSKLGNKDQVLEPENLDETVRQITADLEMLVQQKGAVIKTGELPTLTANATLMYQLFYNLILNSLKFAKEDEPPRINISFETIHQEEKRFAQITLSDNGIGFEPEFNQDIFKTFTRLHPVEDYEGTGLGLALCKKIVERHGGAISASGEPGKGATFTILLPW